MGEKVSALSDFGLAIRSLKQHRRCLWQALRFMIREDQDWWRLPEPLDPLPLMYAIRAVKL
jgi:hypothetical protein